MSNMDANDFYEDDEPVEKIIEVFERGEKFLTAAPSSRGQTRFLDVHGWATVETMLESSNRAAS